MFHLPQVLIITTLNHHAQQSIYLTRLLVQPVHLSIGTC